MEPLNTEQLYRELDGIKAQLTAGFEGVHSRQDIANGRTTTLERKVNIMWFLWSVMGVLMGTVVKKVLDFF